MQPHTIKVTILEDGTITTEVSGIKGQGCEALTTWLNQIGSVEEDRPTGEYYELEGNALTEVQW